MRAFIIRGFGIKKDSAGSQINFDDVEEKLIRPALARCNLSGGTTATYVDAGSIHADMFGEILGADVVVCDITVHNANVFYELGIRHALRKKYTVLIKGDPSADTTPFDIAGGRYLSYPVADPASKVGELVAAIKAGIEGVRETDSPIFQILPTLSEANPADVRVVPMDFIEEVQRAQASQDKGWLRLLAGEVRGEVFQWDGLQAIAQAQWRVKDYSGARESWEAVRAVRPNDVKANLALANVYERLYRDERRSALLEASNQAIERLLAIETLTANHRAEALALNGRNLKTLWRLDFEDLATLEERRERALDERLRRSYDAYREAFQVDLNNFYPGLAALQAGFILKQLSSGAGWAGLFGFDSAEADRYRDELTRQLAALEAVVAASIAAARKRRLPKVDPWAEIGFADLRFITVPAAVFERDPKAFVPTYLGAVPMDDSFARDAVCGQLELFAALGILEGGAKAVIERLKPPKPPKLHLVIVSGHSIDAVGAAGERFPARLEAAAKAALGARIRSLQADGYAMLVLASAAPGTDILAHEFCAETNQARALCLPMPAEVVARDVFARNDGWRNRFIAVIELVKQKKERIFVLHENAELPRWLRAKNADPFERGNRWVMNLAASWGADRVTLLALWDHNEADASVGGTAQMVRLARASANVGIELIDTRTLAAAP